jgi:hypothetical protein
MSVLPESLAPKLAKLLTLLGSDQDGEYLSAARAIKRTLAAKWLDFKDFAAALDRPHPPLDRLSRPPSAPGTRRGRHGHRRP